MKEETRFKATRDEVAKWVEEVRSESGMFLFPRPLKPYIKPDALILAGPAPNFISDIFYLTSAMNHYGLNRALQSFDDLHKEADDLKRHLEFLESSMNSMPTGVRVLSKKFARISVLNSYRTH